MNRFWGSLTLCIALALYAMPAWGQSLDEAIEASKRGDFEAALRGFKALAEMGNADAQSMLGVMYGEGHGVPKDYAKAYK